MVHVKEVAQAYERVLSAWEEMLCSANLITNKEGYRRGFQGQRTFAKLSVRHANNPGIQSLSKRAPTLEELVFALQDSLPALKRMQAQVSEMRQEIMTGQFLTRSEKRRLSRKADAILERLQRKETDIHEVLTEEGKL